MFTSRYLPPKFEEVMLPYFLLKMRQRKHAKEEHDRDEESRSNVNATSACPETSQEVPQAVYSTPIQIIPREEVEEDIEHPQKPTKLGRLSDFIGSHAMIRYPLFALPMSILLLLPLSSHGSGHKHAIGSTVICFEIIWFGAWILRGLIRTISLLLGKALPLFTDNHITYKNIARAMEFRLTLILSMVLTYCMVTGGFKSLYIVLEGKDPATFGHMARMIQNASADLSEYQTGYGTKNTSSTNNDLSPMISGSFNTAAHEDDSPVPKLKFVRWLLYLTWPGIWFTVMLFVFGMIPQFLYWHYMRDVHLSKRMRCMAKANSILKKMYQHSNIPCEGHWQEHYEPVFWPTRVGEHDITGEKIPSTFGRTKCTLESCKSFDAAAQVCETSKDSYTTICQHIFTNLESEVSRRMETLPTGREPCVLFASGRHNIPFMEEHCKELLEAVDFRYDGRMLSLNMLRECFETIRKDNEALETTRKDISRVIGYIDRVIWFLCTLIGIFCVATGFSKGVTGALLVMLVFVGYFSWMMGGLAQEWFASLGTIFWLHLYDVGDQFDVFNMSFSIDEIHLHVRHIHVWTTEFDSHTYPNDIFRVPNLSMPGLLLRKHRNYRRHADLP